MNDTHTSDAVVYLNTHKQVKPQAPGKQSAVLQGRRYPLLNEIGPEDLNGLCGGFECSPESGGIVPVQTTSMDRQVFIWDVDSLPHKSNVFMAVPGTDPVEISSEMPSVNNRFVLSHATLGKPQINCQDSQYRISITAGFDFVYTADQLPASLGIINLVESHCFATLQNGEQKVLLDSGDEQHQLHLQGEVHAEPVSHILDAEKSPAPVSKTHQTTISHAIAEQFNGIEVETTTILEQYTSFFMQREIPASQENIWIPVCAPVSWGWSIRIARRYDGVLGISRQKLFMPTVGHNGLEMPAWQGNLRSIC